MYQNQDDDRGYLTKSELCDLAQKFCNESMTQTRPGGNQFYTGWSASSTLVKKELIEMWSNPKKIKLTEEGKILAQEILAKRQTAENELTPSQNYPQLLIVLLGLKMSMKIKFLKDSA